ncbi:MAG: hypothetical protein CL840_10710 [Crocinitomicaceae bacterium]|nr:hypothetical protein [Crocinitomicaceae bacterium]
MMKRKNIFSIMLGVALLIGSGLLVAGTKGEKGNTDGPKKVKITIVKDDNGTLNKSEETIEVSNREDIHTYLKSKDIDLESLEIYPRKRHPHNAIWVYNKSGKEIHHRKHVMIVNTDEEVEKTDGEEKIRIKTMVIEDEDSPEAVKQEIKIEKRIDEDGNVTVQKWVNGEEVDPEERHKHHRMKMTENGDEITLEMKGEKGNPNKTIKIKKEVDEDGNVTVLKSVNGGEFEKIENGDDNVMCMKRMRHRGGRRLGFAARSEDGSVMVFVNPIQEDSERSSSINEQGDNALEISDISFYPNPAENRFSIAFDSAEKGQILVRIMDLQGKEFLSKEYDHSSGKFEQELELKDAQPGMYLFTVTQNGKTYKHKLMVK